MKPWDHFIGPCTAWATLRTLKDRRVYPMHLQGPLVNVGPVNVDQLTFDQKEKKKQFLAQFQGPSQRNFSRSAVATQLCQVKPISIYEQHNFRTQFQGNKMWNQVLYLTLSFHQRCQIKKGHMQTPYFVRPRFTCRTLKILKILSFLHGAVKTFILMWRNSFGHRSTRIAILGQTNQNVPSQPYVDQK